MRDPHDTVTRDLLNAEAARPVGRPRQHQSQADRQRAYRERLRASGRRVVQRVVADVRGDQPPTSSVILLPPFFK